MASNVISIPRATPEEVGKWTTGKPCWAPRHEWAREGETKKALKPLIRCNCGQWTGIALHHVHADGTVTNSFFHKRGNTPPEDPRGCNWHVWLKLLDYDQGDFPSKKK